MEKKGILLFLILAISGLLCSAQSKKLDKKLGITLTVGWIYDPNAVRINNLRADFVNKYWGDNIQPKFEHEYLIWKYSGNVKIRIVEDLKRYKEGNRSRLDYGISGFDTLHPGCGKSHPGYRAYQ